MIKKKLYLITTSDERTWKFDRPVLFLGDWCRLYNRRHIWQNMDAVVSKPYGLELSKKNADFQNVKKLEENLFPKLCDLLNKHHLTKHNYKFWSILIGHWFRHFVNLVVNKVNTLENCLNSYEISGVTIFQNNDYSLATLDFRSAIRAIDDERWNRVLNDNILTHFKDLDISIEVIKEQDDFDVFPGFLSKIDNHKRSLRDNILNICKKFYFKLSRRLVKKTDALIIGTYLPSIEEIKLELALGQWPQMWSRSKYEKVINPNRLLRENLKKKILCNSNNTIENILCSLLFELIPINYLEGFRDLKEIIKKQQWPSSPKFIFTSNNFHTDEIFKFYSAIKTENNSKYYIGQHGNNYYTMKNRFPRIEEKIADKFFTWGWKNNLKNFKPAFIFKTAGKKEMKHNSEGGLLLVETSLNLRLTTWNTYDDFKEYFDDQKKFVNLLTQLPRQFLTIRLDPSYKNKRTFEDLRWFDFDSSLKIDLGESKIEKLIKDSRLVIHSYDSTGFLETISQNIPTLAFWQNNFDHLRENVKSDYQSLVDAGIIHLSPKSAADKVNEIWEDVDGWWSQNQLQDTVKNFCNIYAKKINNPSKKMASLLLEK